MRRLVTIDMRGRAPARDVGRPDVLNEQRPLPAVHRSPWSCMLAICAVTALLGAGGMKSNAESLAPFPNDPNLGRAMAIQAAYQQALFATPGVNGVGIGQVNGSLALLVAVRDTNHVAELPSSIDGLPVNVQNVGTIHAGICAGLNPQATYPLPVPLGVSGGNTILFSGCCASGTIGFKVRDNATGAIGWISNNHVVGHGSDGCPSTAPIGTAQYQPGPIDTTPACSAGQLIGALSRTIPINFAGGDNLVDCGFVQSSDLAISSTILNLGPQVNNVVPAFVGQAVQKNGRTSDCTEGIVQAVNFTALVDYSESAPCATTCGTAVFTNQIMISPTAPSTVFVQAGDSGSPIVDAANNAVGLLFAGNVAGDVAVGNPIGAVLSALNVSLASTASSQVVTRTSRYWFTHGYSSDTNCATLLAAIQRNGSVINLGFVNLPTANRNADNVVDANDTFIETLSFYWRASGRTGEPGGSQGAKLKASALCAARKKLAVELIGAIANASLLNTFPGNATYKNGGTITNFPPDLISQAQTTGAGYDVVAIRTMTALLKKFNSSGVTNNLPNGLEECSAQPGKVLKPISQDPMLQGTCPGVNNSCVAAQVVAFPNSSNPFAAAVFTSSANLGGYTNNMPAPSCNSGGRDAVWQIPPSIGTAGRPFTVYTAGSNFNTMLAVWSGTCDNLTPVVCADKNLGVAGEQLSFTTDGINTFFIVGEGAVGQYGKLKIKITSP